jgi:hypothetical protein
MYQNKVLKIKKIYFSTRCSIHFYPHLYLMERIKRFGKLEGKLKHSSPISCKMLS